VDTYTDSVEYIDAENNRNEGIQEGGEEERDFCITMCCAGYLKATKNTLICQRKERGLWRASGNQSVAGTLEKCN